MKTILTIIVLLVTTFGFSQTVISGKILNQKDIPVSLANIYISGSYDGATATENGEFSFTTTLSGNQTLVITALGFEDFSKAIVIEEFQNQTIVLEKKANQLEEVAITAGSMQSGDKARVSVLKPLDILTTAGNPGDIVSALKTLPGTQIVGESGKLFVRGGTADETQTYIDGIRVAQPYVQTANNVPTRSTFSPLLFKGTTFTTGGYSAEFGEALSSVLLMNTIDDPDVAKTDLSVMTVGLGLGNIQKWKKNSLSFNTSYINLAPYQFLMPDNIHWNKPYQTLGGETVFRQHLDRGLLKIYASFATSEFDLNQEDINFTNAIRTAFKTNNFYTNASYKGSFGSNWKLATGFSFGSNSNRGIFDVTNFQTRENATHVKLKIAKSVSNAIKTIFGVDYFDTYFDEKANASLVAYNAKLAAFYSETDVLFSEKVIAKIGFRATRNYLLDENTISPRVAMAYKASKNHQFSTAYGIFEQAPQQDYLKYANNLQSEKARHYILNYELNKEKQFFKAEFYYKNYTDLVKYNTQNPQFNSVYTNNGSGFAKGLELYWKDQKSIKNLEYWISYSYIDSERDYKNFPKQVTPHFVANHTLSVVGKYWIQDWRSQIGATYSFSSGRPYNNPNELQFMNGKTKTYNDLSVNWAYLISPQKILFFSVSNILGIKNVYGYNYKNTPNINGIFESKAITPTADRFFFVGFFWTISKDKKINQLENL